MGKEISRIDLAVTQKKLQVKLTIAAQKSAKGIEGLTLTGELSKDRQILHQVHDTIFQTLFGSGGVADTRILYTVRTRQSEQATQWTYDVWQADYDGGNAKQVTHDQCLCVTPTFIPSLNKGHCRHFLYVSYKAGQPKIFAATLGESGAKRLTLLRGNQLMPTVAPTLDKVAFISDITGNPDLFIQDFSSEQGLIGKPRQIFSAPGGAQGTPTFSPDGKKIAFVSNKDGTPRIYMLDIPAAGASLKNLRPQIISKKTKENTSPAWSPDGKKIAYSAVTSGIRQIWIYDLSTGEEFQVTEGSGHKENPTWAPNSFHLMFNSSTTTASDLFLINLNQRKAIKITQGAGEKRFPAWELCKN
jgi:TolB protein